MGAHNNEENHNRRPTPVRMVMDGGEGPETEAKSDVKAFLDPLTGDSWVARVSGRSNGGVLPLRTIPLMEVEFFKETEPDSPLRHAVWQGASLEGLDEGALNLLFQASNPYSTPKPEEAPRDRKKRRGRPRRSG